MGHAEKTDLATHLEDQFLVAFILMYDYTVHEPILQSTIHWSVHVF